MGSQDSTKGKRSDAWAKDPNEVIIPGFDNDAGPEHPLYDRRIERLKTLGREAVAGMIESILRNGQINEISCRKNGEEFECGPGKHRLLALRYIRNEGIDPNAMVRITYPRLTDQQWRDRIIAENMERTDSDAFTEAMAFADYLKFATMSDLARITRMKTKTLDAILALVQMPAEVRELVLLHNVKRDIAIEIATLHTSKQEATLRAYLASPIQTQTTARAIVAREKGGEPKAAAPRTYLSVREIRAAAVASQKGNLPQLPADARMLLAALNGEALPDEVPDWLTALLTAAGRG